MEEEEVDCVAESILDELVEHLALGLCHQTHRAAKLGYLELEEVAAEEESKATATSARSPGNGATIQQRKAGRGSRRR